MQPIDGEALKAWTRKNLDKVSKHDLARQVLNAPTLSGAYIHRDTLVRMMVDHFYPNPTMARYDFLRFLDLVPTVNLEDIIERK